ncbi:MAG TPA: DUF5681 domain-containing protein [Rhizomicrobium sp.]|jgi:hypothetical protein
MTDEKDSVGRGRPPKHTQFRKGQTGNAKGRPKGSRNFFTEFTEEFSEKIPVRENGKIKKVSKGRATVKSTFARAIQGDAKHTSMVFNVAQKLEGQGAETPQAVSDVRREEILKRHEARQRAWFFEEFQRLQGDPPHED